MTADGTAGLSHRRRVTGAGGCVLLAAVAIVLVGLGALGLLGARRHYERKVEAALAGYRAAGQPVTWEELLALRPEVPDEENAALVLLRAHEAAQPLGDGGAEDFIDRFGVERKAGARHSVQTRALVGAYLAENAEALRLIREASRLEHGLCPRGPVAHAYPVAAREYRRALRTAGRLCAAAAALHAEEGRAGAAADSLQAAAAVARSVGPAVTLTEGAARMTAEWTWLRATERALEVCELPPDALARFRRAAAEGQGRLSLVLPFYGARATAHAAFSGEGPFEAAARRSMSGGVWLAYDAMPGWRERDALHCYDIMTRAARAASLPLRERTPAADALAADVESAFAESPFTYAMSGHLLPSVKTVIQGEVAAHARLRVGQAALAVEQWRMRHCAWPEALEQLAPDLLEAVPEDPFSDDLLIYRRTEDGVVIYSVGSDGADDGGISREEARAAERAGPGEFTWDIGFRLLDPALRGARETSFAEDMQAAYVDLEDLAAIGLGRERLKELGFADEDIEQVE